MRIAERGEHTAQVRRNVLHDKGERHVFFLARGRKHEISEGQKGEQRHIVGDEHRADKGDVGKGKHAGAGVFKRAHDLLRQKEEKPNVFQGADHRQNAEQTGQRFPIEVVRIRLVGRDDTGRDRRRAKGDEQHGVFLYKRQNAAVQKQADMERMDMPLMNSVRAHGKLLFLRCFGVQNAQTALLYTFL